MRKAGYALLLVVALLSSPAVAGGWGGGWGHAGWGGGWGHGGGHHSGFNVGIGFGFPAIGFYGAPAYYYPVSVCEICASTPASLSTTGSLRTCATTGLRAAQCSATATGTSNPSPPSGATSASLPLWLGRSKTCTECVKRTRAASSGPLTKHPDHWTDRSLQHIPVDFSR
jgi:hypothetical protein